MDEQEPLGDQFPFIRGKAMGIDDDNRLLKYKLWLSLVRLSEHSDLTSIDDGADFAFNIENEINRLEGELE